MPSRVVVALVALGALSALTACSDRPVEQAVDRSTQPATSELLPQISVPTPVGAQAETEFCQAVAEAKRGIAVLDVVNGDASSTRAQFRAAFDAVYGLTSAAYALRPAAIATQADFLQEQLDAYAALVVEFDYDRAAAFADPRMVELSDTTLSADSVAMRSTFNSFVLDQCGIDVS